MYTLAIYAYKTAYPVPLLSFLVSLSLSPSFVSFLFLRNSFTNCACFLYAYIGRARSADVRTSWHDLRKCALL